MTLTDLFSLTWFALTIFCAIAIKCRDDVIRAQCKHIDELEAIAHEALNQRDRYAAIADYVRDADAVVAALDALAARNEYLEQRRRLVLRRWWIARRNRSYDLAAWALKGIDGR